MVENSRAVLPQVAIALYTDGVPWFPYRHHPGGQILYTAVPSLPGPRGSWARLHRGDVRLYTDLTSESTLAELIYCTPTIPEPGALGSDTLIDQVQHTLTVCRCNPNVLAGWVAAEYGDHLYDLRPNARMAACRAKARQLLAAEHGAPGLRAGVV